MEQLQASLRLKLIGCVLPEGLRMVEKLTGFNFPSILKWAKQIRLKRGMNPRPPVYRTRALTNWAPGPILVVLYTSELSLLGVGCQSEAINPEMFFLSCSSKSDLVRSDPIQLVCLTSVCSVVSSFLCHSSSLASSWRAWPRVHRKNLLQPMWRWSRTPYSQ